MVLPDKIAPDLFGFLSCAPKKFWKELLVQALLSTDSERVSKWWRKVRGRTYMRVEGEIGV